MNNLKEYIIEKLHLDKDIELGDSKPGDPSTWSVGDIIVSIFSYSMVIVDFYEITKRTNKSFVLKKLKEKIVKGDGQRGESVPLPGEYDTNEPEVKARINKFGDVKIDRAYCHLWDGNPVSFDHMD